MNKFKLNKFKPLIDYYKNVKNLLYDILRISILIIPVYYLSKNYRKQFNIFIEIPLMFITYLIFRSYDLNIISFNESISYFITLLIITGIITGKIRMY